VSPNNAMIADFVEHVANDALPDDVIDMARRSLLDWFAVSLSAMDEPEALALSRYVASWGGTGRAMTLFGSNGPAAPVALVNGTLAHLLDFDDIHYDAAMHAGAPTWAAALGLGMARGVAARRILRAFVAGYEVAAAFGINGTGLALAGRGWHPTAVLAHLSSAVAACVLLGLDRAGIASALGTAAAQAGGLVSAGGTASKPLQVGKAAMGGVIAAEMAELSLNGNGSLVESGQLGLFQAMIGRDVPLGGLGANWRLLGNSYKPYASCAFTHAAIEAAGALSRVASVSDIRAVKIFANPFAVQVAGCRMPAHGSEARFSLSYAVALGLLGADATPDQFGGEHLDRADIRAILERTELVVEPAIERWSSHVELVLANGDRLSETVLIPKGAEQRPLGWADLEKKFDVVAHRRLGGRAEQMLIAIRSFGEGNQVEAIRTLLLAQDPR
jgi:2-methylcitrate dehydratase PrpD